MEVRLARPHDKHAQYVDRNRLLGQTPNDRSGRAAQSDVVRLNVLANHGGVWADAMVACMQPLDLWLDAALKPTGFWMYRGDYIGGKRSPCSWFMLPSAAQASRAGGAAWDRTTGRRGRVVYRPGTLAACAITFGWTAPSLPSTAPSARRSS